MVVLAGVEQTGICFFKYIYQAKIGVCLVSVATGESNKHFLIDFSGTFGENKPFAFMIC
jgi:hypothetical protein